MSFISCTTDWLANNVTIFFYLAAILGFASIFKVFVNVFKGVRNIFRNRINFRERYGDGAWALVTGGSEGIGR